jgi:shikimate 5-dehydrogenase
MASSLRQLLEEGLVSLALLPDNNDYILSEEGKKKREELLKKGLVSVDEEFHKLSSDEKKKYLSLDSLEQLIGYTVPLIAHDYGAKTPIMWNALYEIKGIPVRNIMVVGEKSKAREILEALKKDPKYLGGGAGVGFKEAAIPYLDSTVPQDLQAVNIIVNDKGKLVGRNTDAEGFVRSLEESLSKVEKIVKGRNFVVYGGGGVAKEVTKLLAEKGANHIRIVNRTYSKAVGLANFLNEHYRQIAVGVGEDMSRGVVLNSEIKVDALINLSDKGSDGPLVGVAMYEGANDKNETLSRVILRELKHLRPEVVIADIVLPKSGKSISLRLAEQAGIENLLDGKPMVIYQAVPAYKMIEQAHLYAHNNQNLNENEILEIFQKAVA